LEVFVFGFELDVDRECIVLESGSIKEVVGWRKITPFGFKMSSSGVDHNQSVPSTFPASNPNNPQLVFAAVVTSFHPMLSSNFVAKSIIVLFLAF